VEQLDSDLVSHNAGRMQSQDDIVRHAEDDQVCADRHRRKYAPWNIDMLEILEA
jgi:hypothetical protein